MARPFSLASQEADILSTRVFISRSIQLFTIGELAESWDISESTVHRYHKPAYRALTRKINRDLYEKRRNETEPTNCYKCNGLLEGHPRCKECTILIHEGTYCRDCYDRREDERLREYRELTPLV